MRELCLKFDRDICVRWPWDLLENCWRYILEIFLRWVIDKGMYFHWPSWMMMQIWYFKLHKLGLFAQPPLTPPLPSELGPLIRLHIFTVRKCSSWVKTFNVWKASEFLFNPETLMCIVRMIILWIWEFQGGGGHNCENIFLVLYHFSEYLEQF